MITENLPPTGIHQRCSKKKKVILKGRSELLEGRMRKINKYLEK